MVTNRHLNTVCSSSRGWTLSVCLWAQTSPVFWRSLTLEAFQEDWASEKQQGKWYEQLLHQVLPIQTEEISVSNHLVTYNQQKMQYLKQINHHSIDVHELVYIIKKKL